MRQDLPRDERIRLKKFLLQRDGPDCGICGQYMEEGDRSIDHRKQLCHGGTNDIENLRLAHKKCNNERPEDDTSEEVP